MQENDPTSHAPEAEFRLENIEALRALAVVAVMLFHYTAAYAPEYLNFTQAAWPASHGYIGVELFFVISGFQLRLLFLFHLLHKLLSFLVVVGLDFFNWLLFQFL